MCSTECVVGNAPREFFSTRYDNEVFESAAPAYDNVFASNRPAPLPAYKDFLQRFGNKPQAEEKRRPVAVDDDGDDLLGGFGRSPAEEKRKPAMAEVEEMGSTGFDDLIRGFAGRSPPRNR